MKDDYYYMERCKVLGRNAGEKGNSPVGALIVKDGNIIAEAEEANKTKNDVTCHAEIEAIRIAVKKSGADLSGAILYTTHEPCVMCSYAIRFYRISKVVYLHAVDHLGGATSSMPLLVSNDVPPKWGKKPEVVHLISEKQ
ncbi:MAG: nucleoside deaminase [Chitinophagaceae bacterium]|nr:nucleoside deaminase [Chitinophagaceae bacterium]